MNNTARNLLKARIAARNAVHARIKELAPKFFEAIRSLVGTKVKLANGYQSKAFVKAIEHLKTPGDYWGEFHHSLFKVFRECRQIENSVAYEEENLYLGDLDDGVLVNTVYADKFDPKHFRSDYTIEEVETIQEQIKQKEEEISNLKNQMLYFF